MKPKKILMVCRGNICRSPAAEGIFRDKFPKWEVESGCTVPLHVGKHPDPRAIEVCRNHGIDISKIVGRQVKESDGDYFDYILAMDHRNIDNLQATIHPKNHHKIKLIDKNEITDPYFSPMDEFEIMFQQLEKAAKKWKKKV